MNETAPQSPPDVENKPTTLQVKPRTWFLLLGTVVLMIVGAVLVNRSPSWGDNGFPVDSPAIESQWLVRGGTRDLVPALTNPPLLNVADAQALKMGRKPMLLPVDRVLGVAYKGMAVCVPARALNWHEVVNLTLGDVDLALTFSPLGDAPRVYVRDGFEFGHSGLLYCSNPLLYDVGETPSLWSQLDGKARSGPRAGEQLEEVPCELAQWGDWTKRYPDTLVVRPKLEERGKFYRRNSYGPYRRSKEVRFPAPEAPPGIEPKARVLVVEAGGERLVYPVKALLKHVDRSDPEVLEHRWTTTQAGQDVTFVIQLDTSEADPHSIRVEAPARLVSQGLWFSLAAFDPELRPAAVD